MAACVTDLDCPGSQACYTNISWYNLPGNGCMCSSWYRWTGADCTVRTPTSIFWLTSAILISVTSLFYAVVTIINGIRLFRAGRFSLVRDSTATANWQLLIGFVAQGLSQLLVAIEAGHPDTSNLTNFYGDKITLYQPAHGFLFVLGGCMAIIAGITIALVWVEVAERANRLTSSARGTVIPKVMIGTVLAGANNISLLSGLFTLFGLIFIYLFGFFKLSREMSRIAAAGANEQQKELYRGVISEIRWTMSGVLFGVCVVFIFGVLIIVLELKTWKEYCKPDEIPSLIVVWQLFPFAMLVSEIFILNALRKAIARRINQLKTSSDTPINNPVRVAASNGNQDIKAQRESSRGGQKPVAGLQTPKSGNSHHSLSESNRSGVGAGVKEAIVAHQGDASS